MQAKKNLSLLIVVERVNKKVKVQNLGVVP